VASAAGRRRATRYITEKYEHIPAELLARQIRGVANCDRVETIIESARRERWSLDAEQSWSEDSYRLC
jgi:hypothetical protein